MADKKSFTYLYGIRDGWSKEKLEDPYLRKYDIYNTMEPVFDKLFEAYTMDVNMRKYLQRRPSFMLCILRGFTSFKPTAIAMAHDRGTQVLMEKIVSMAKHYPSFDIHDLMDGMQDLYPSAWAVYKNEYPR